MSDQTPNSVRLSLTKTQLPPCCLRIHPNDTSKIFIGTYKLESNGRKHGSLDLYHFLNGSLDLIHSTPTSSAILDLKISPKDANLLITAHSNGSLSIWRYKNDTIELLKDVNIDEETIITSVFFNPNDSSQLLLTFTNGYSGIYKLLSSKMDYFDTCHELECWTGSFGEAGQLTNVVYTGGDDSKLIAHDLRMKNEIWTMKRGHQAGIVSILSPNQNWNSNMTNTLLTGSYDDHLRVLDLRVTDKSNPTLIQSIFPKVKYEDNLGGGVWRLIPSPVDNRLLTCCMYEGARIIDHIYEEGFEIARYFKRDHQSMCYGGDWSSDGKYIATCSFYDNVVQTWSPDKIENII